MIIAHIHPPALIPRVWVLHPDYKDNPTKTRSTYALVQEYSKYCRENDVVYYDVGINDDLLASKLDTFVSIDLLQRIKNRSALLAIDLTEESFYRMIDKIYQHIVIEQDIPADQILLICHSFDMADKIKEVAKKLNQPELKCEYYGFWERLTKMTIIRTLNDLGLHDFKSIDNTKQSGLYNYTTKKYVSLNGTWREHRVALLCLLEYKKLITEGHVSFSLSPHKIGFIDPMQKLTTPYRGLTKRPEHIEIKEKESLDKDWEIWHTKLTNLFPKIKTQLLKGYSAKDNLPLILDSNDFAPYLAWANQTYLLRYYKNSYFSIVTETSFMREFSDDAPTQFLYRENTAPRYISEKIFKCMGHKHPFIFAGISDSLNILKTLGYKTYEGIIDESYDQEHDDSLRLLKIADEVERLCKLHGQDLIEFKERCKEIAEHNFNVFMNKQNYIIQLI